MAGNGRSGGPRRALQQQDVVPEGYVLPAYAAVQVALAAAARDCRLRPTPAERLSGDFQTAIGPIRFDDKGDLAATPTGCSASTARNSCRCETQ